MDQFNRIKVAVVQAAPVLFEREATVEKVCQLTVEAAAEGAGLVLFPEAFIPGYPRGLSFGTVVGSRSPAGRCTMKRVFSMPISIWPRWPEANWTLMWRGIMPGRICFSWWSMRSQGCR